MDLLLWRHAEAHDLSDANDTDLNRRLTPRGEKQAQRMARWLEQHLPDGARILCSPALRCEATVAFLGRKYKIRDELSPTHSAQDLLSAAQWPKARVPVLIVGHQPTLGQVIAQLMQMPQSEFSVRKASVWWLRSRQRDEREQVLIHCVQSPDMVW